MQQSPLFNPKGIQESPKQVLFTNGEDPDEMLHNVEFYQGLHCLLLKVKKKDLQTTKYIFKTITEHP